MCGMNKTEMQILYLQIFLVKLWLKYIHLKCNGYLNAENYIAVYSRKLASCGLINCGERTYSYNTPKTEYVTLGQMEVCQPLGDSTRCGHLTGRLANRLSGTRVYKSHGGAGLGVCVLWVLAKVRAFSAATQPGLTLGSSSCFSKEQPPHGSWAP